MARIRSIKPEFWSSPGIETLDPMARLLYIALWNWADDNGVGVANPREIAGFAFPLDEETTVADVRRMLVEIRRVFGVVFYTVAGRQYYAIPSWEKHQKFDRRSKGKYPSPDDADSIDDLGKHSHSTESHESTSSARRDSVAGTGEQGNRGTGEQISSSPTARDIASAFDHAYQHWPKKVERKEALERFKKASKSIPLPDLVSHVVRFGQAYAATTEKRFVPALGVWLNGERWTDELPGTQAAQEAANKPRPIGGPNGLTIEEARAESEARAMELLRLQEERRLANVR